jgi:hypothetical protein
VLHSKELAKHVAEVRDVLLQMLGRGGSLAVVESCQLPGLVVVVVMVAVRGDGGGGGER